MRFLWFQEHDGGNCGLSFLAWTPFGVKFRACSGAALAMLDMASDVYVINVYQCHQCHQPDDERRARETSHRRAVSDVGTSLEKRKEIPDMYGMIPDHWSKRRIYCHALAGCAAGVGKGCFSCFAGRHEQLQRQPTRPDPQRVLSGSRESPSFYHSCAPRARSSACSFGCLKGGVLILRRQRRRVQILLQAKN
jgi:hypothetical protein